MVGMRQPRIIKTESNEVTWKGENDDKGALNAFEKEYIKWTIDHYTVESKKWIVDMSCSEYVKKASDALRREEEKVQGLLEKESGEKLLDEVQTVVITQHAEELLNNHRSGASFLIEQNKMADLKALTILFSKKPDTLKPLAEKLAVHAKSKGDDITKDKETTKNAKLYITKIIELKKKMDAMVLEGFEGIQLFFNACNKEIKIVLSAFELSPEFLAEYFDYLMREGLRGKESGTESLIADAFSIFQLISSKDAFAHRHQVFNIF